MTIKFTLSRYSVNHLLVFALSVFLYFGDVLTCHGQTLPLPDHIVILIEENQANASVIGNSVAPYIDALAADTAHGAVFTQAYAIEHPSQPNYLDFFSGSNQGVTDDNVPTSYPFSTPNLAAQLIAASKSFKTYSQDMPSVGFDGASSSQYVRKHNPVTNWIGTGTNLVSDTLNQPFTDFPSDFTQLPTVSYVVPNEDSDMHNGVGNPTIAAGDFWMHEHLNTFLNWVLNNNTLFIYTFDEDDGSANNNIPTLFYGPMVQGGQYTNTINLFDMLRTIEDIYGLPHAGSAATATTITNCWRSVDTVQTGVKTIGPATPYVKTYPNPASSTLHFNTTGLSNGAELGITDVTGRSLMTLKLSNAESFEISTANLPSGIYFYHLYQLGNSVCTGKFSVVH